MATELTQLPAGLESQLPEAIGLFRAFYFKRLERAEADKDSLLHTHTSYTQIQKNKRKNSRGQVADLKQYTSVSMPKLKRQLRNTGLDAITDR